MSEALRQAASASTSALGEHQLHHSVVKQIPVAPVTGWKGFPSQAIPSGFCYGSIYHYIVETATLLSTGDCDSDGEDYQYYGTSKSFRRRQQYVQSGYVSALNDVKFKDYYFLKAVVKSSFNADKFYHVIVCLSYMSGAVMDGSCQCKASSMGRCSHVCAVLLVIKDYVLSNGYDAAACTSKMCSWNTGSKRKNP